ncbi:MAG: hypothetical protein JNM18_19795 [Planctomycetaceae bacterium]|nr:hypothetical protein [Planctomycetaceae bacterium]
MSSTPWDQATLRDLLDATSHLESVEFEVRRGGFRLPPLNTTRRLQREHILPLSDISLVESGLDPRDWVLVRSLGRPTTLLRWNSNSKNERSAAHENAS